MRENAVKKMVNLDLFDEKICFLYKKKYNLDR